MLRYTFHNLLALGALTLLGLTAGPAFAQLIITPTFDSSITTLPDAALIESAINTAINKYETTFTNNVNISIDFKNMSSGLGESTWEYFNVGYSSFIGQMRANAISANQLTAISLLPQSNTDPVSGSSSINAKPANLVALGYNPASLNLAGTNGFDGIIGLNTGLTTTGNGTATGPYSLLTTTEHEIDEILGLGSASGGEFLNGDPLPEDLFRYSSNGTRNYNANPTVAASLGNAYFSLDGATFLAQFNNQNNGADWGDWQSNPLPNGVNPQVQDAFASPNTAPTLGVNEITALNVIGWNLSSQGPTGTPEPGPVALLLSAGLVGAGALVRRRGRR